MLGISYGSEAEESDDERQPASSNGNGLVAYVDDDEDNGAAADDVDGARSPRILDTTGTGASKESAISTAAAAAAAAAVAVEASAAQIARNYRDVPPVPAGSQTRLLPPRPTGPVDPSVVQKIQALARHKESGMDINGHIFQKKNFNNPSLHEKLIGMLDIDQTGTNCAPDQFDPKQWGAEDMIEAILEAQRAAEQRRALRPQVNFQPPRQH